MVCASCNADIDREEPARYDVFVKTGPILGPYCGLCFASTATGQAVAEPSNQVE